MAANYRPPLSLDKLKILVKCLQTAIEAEGFLTRSEFELANTLFIDFGSRVQREELQEFLNESYKEGKKPTDVLLDLIAEGKLGGNRERLIEQERNAMDSEAHSAD